MKIILVGYMGSGKTTVGKMLAKELQLSFIDLDAYIEKAEGMSIPALFQHQGEVYFRKQEIQYLTEILSKQNSYVLSTGGGAPCFGENIQMMNAATPNTIYLKASINTLVERLKKEREQRPLLKNSTDAELQEYIAKHLFERSYFYNQARLKTVVDDRLPLEIVTELKGMLI